MIQKLKGLAQSSLGIVAFIAVFAIPFLFFKGAVWASEHLMGPLMVVATLALVLDIVVLLPLSVFRGLRRYTGGLILASSFLFGLLAWLFGFIVTYSLWGGFAVVIGLMFFGVGVVFMALLASLFSGSWNLLLTVAVLGVVTMVSRFAGVAIGSSSES